MKVYILFAQRNQDYAGQYGVEALVSMSEYEFDENPSFMLEKLEEYEKTKEFESLKIIPTEVDEQKIQEILSPIIESKIV